jgi:hypothetical protein
MTQPSRLDRAERRLRAAEALVRDLEQAVRDEQALALYTSTGSARAAQAHYERALSELEATPRPVVAVHLLPLPPTRRVNPRPRFLRRGQ